MPNPLYTIGLQSNSLQSLTSHIKAHGIDCVVDIRDHGQASTKSDFNSEWLTQHLHAIGVHYLSFANSFGRRPPQCYNARGKLVMKKLLNTTEFKEGEQRLLNGIEKGFTILIIDWSSFASESIRYKAIGKQLTAKGITVIHIEPDNNTYTQEDIDKVVNAHNQRKTDNKKDAQELGIIGEEIAGLYLIQHGFSILDKNWNLYHGCELDIVARKGNKIHFVEVKTRSTDRFGPPESAINRQKFLNICNAIREYKYRNWIRNCEHQIDCIAILYSSEKDYEINYIPDIHLR